ncbi:MAG: NAD(P)/FAD-dependent oxidoreductase [Chloroflexi bacterium]|nr:NAD(P)/FAD-dependent oxidoreductase [Chloroflexota bacterium]
MAKTEKTKYLIIGNSAGGIGAAEAIRKADKTGAISIVSDESYPAYCRPLISEHLAEGCPLERMLFRPADFYEKNNIQTFLGKKVARLDIDGHTIKLENGREITWEKLLLSTGGVPIFPRMKGAERQGVFTFTTLDDAKAIGRFLDKKSRAVVIGGGLIGISVTEALVKRGVKVTVIEMRERVLNIMLDEEASALEETTLKQAGVKIITNHTVAEIKGTSSTGGTVSGVTLDDGSSIPCNLLIVAIGVQPRIELASGTAIKVNRGLVVNRQMATSCPDVYACGDAAEAYDFNYGENRLTPIWPNAYLGGRIAGFNMAGTPTQYPGGTALNSLKYFGLASVSAGIVNPPKDGYEILSRKDNNTYRKIILKDGLVAGLVFVGDIEKSGIVFNLMKDKVNVNGFKQALIAADFGLSSLPEKIWRQKLEKPLTSLTPQATAAPVEEEAIAGE